MRLLMIGGTVFLGRHLVSLAVAAGHQVTMLNRGTRDLPEQANIERLIADRDGDLSVLAGRTFDAVIDTCGYHPEQLRRSVGALAGAVGTYIFISTISAYGDIATIGITEEAPIKNTPNGEEGTYGTLKADCEEVLRILMPGNSLIIRPGLIVGPGDPTDRFTYWPARVARGGMIAVPGKAERLIQFIDVRDLAAFILTLAEAQALGIYHVAGPAMRMTMGAFIDSCEQAVRPEEYKFVHIEEAVLLKTGIEPWSEMPLWIPEVKRNLMGMMRIDIRKALEAGLTHRPPERTIADTLEWDQTRDPDAPRLAGLSAEREAKLLLNPKIVDVAGKGPPARL